MVSKNRFQVMAVPSVETGSAQDEQALKRIRDELNEMFPPETTATIAVLHYLDGLGVKVSDSVAKQDAQKRGVADPADSTLEIIKLASAISTAQGDGKLTDADAQALTKQLQSLKIDVNPRYGTFNPQTASIELTTPGWVKPLNAAQ